MTEALWIGIDVSKDKLDIAQGAQSKVYSVPNDLESIERLARELKKLEVTGIILEATGGYQRLAVGVLLKRKLPVVVINPKRVRDFANALGRNAKNDALDAAVLAQFGQCLNPPVLELPDVQLMQLQELISRREELVQMLVAEKNRLQQAWAKPVQNSIRAVIRVIERQIDHCNTRLDKAIQDTPAWKARNEIVQSIPGVGPTTARCLLLKLPELGQLSDKEISALVGVAPMDNDSGAHRGQRHIFGGRASVRMALWMATITAIRVNPVIRKFFDRLKAAQKPHKVAAIACMRKLLVIANAIVRSGKPWTEKAA